MSSLSNTTYNSRSMNGLINVNANTGTFTDLEVNNLIVNQSGTAPTMSSTDNSNRIATTAFVQSHTSGAYVTLNTNQTISGQKTFSNANTYFSGAIADTSYTANKIELDANPSIHQLKVSANNIYFKATQSVQFDADTGYLTFASPANSYFTNNTGTGKIVQILDTNFTPLSFEVNTGYNYIRSFSPLSILTSGTNNMNIAPNGNLNLAGSSITISNATSFNSTTTFNTSLPTTTLTPTVSNQLVSKAYVDSAISGGLSGYMNLTTAQTANGDKTFNGITTFDNAVIANFQITNNDVASFQNGAFFDNVCPYSTVVATGSQDLVTKGFTETSTQTITGAKTFNNITINQNAGSDINMTINTVGSDNFYFNFSTLAQLRLHYVNALNRINMYVPTTGKALSLGLGSTEYLRLDSSLTGGAGVLCYKLSTGFMNIQSNRIDQPTAGQDLILSLQNTNYITLSASTSKVTLAPTRCASYLEVVGEIQANNPIEVTYNPSSISAGRIGYQVLYNWNTLPVVGGTNQIGGGPFNFPAVGVWNCELYVGWAQTSNNRAISISLNTLIDYTRAQFSTQQNSSYQQLNLTTIISVTSTATNYYLLQQCGSNAGGFGGTQQQYFRITRIA